MNENREKNDVIPLRISELLESAYKVKSNITFHASIRDRADIYLYGTIYHLVKNNGKMFIVIYDLTTDEWLVGDYTEEEITR
jgi:hypothetical protein